jgi:beta-phosphoglucomutase
MITAIKGCIFDLDGVICDTARYHYLAWKKLACDLDIGFTELENEALKGVSRMKSLDILLGAAAAGYSEKEKLQMAEKKNEWYVNYINQMTKTEINTGIINFISELKSGNIKISLGSVSKNAPIILRKLEIEDLFDVIIDGNTVINAKPDPEVFLTAAANMDLPPQNCIVFEDAVSGIQAAHNAGMKCVGVGSPQILNIADYIIPDFKDITFLKIKNALSEDRISSSV